MSWQSILGDSPIDGIERMDPYNHHLTNRSEKGDDKSEALPPQAAVVIIPPLSSSRQSPSTTCTSSSSACPFSSSSLSASSSKCCSSSNHYRPPTGKWKDGFCDWYKNCAPSCLMGSFLNCILLGQVAQRMNYWLKFKEVTLISLCLWGLSYILYSALPKNAGPGGVSNLIYAVFFLIVLCQLRGVVRARYAIPGDQYCDCCASFWCSCCTLTQLARHLFNYQGSCSECSMGPDAEYLIVIV